MTTEKQEWLELGPGIRTEYMKICLFLASKHPLKLEASQIYSARWPCGDAWKVEAHLVAMRLLCDVDKSCLPVDYFYQGRTASVRNEIRQLMDKGRRMGFTLRGYKAWRNRL